MVPSSSPDCSEIVNGPRMLFCNQGIGEVVSLQPPDCSEIVKVGLRYDPTCNNYKVVTLSASENGRTSSWTVDVYSVRDGCWHTLHGIGGSLKHFDSYSFDGEAVLNANGRVINWLGFHKVWTMILISIILWNL
ncbi:unnamed protein product [Cuscuta europaea]|uniref:Uncharacterized protein n=1 Tax=Cuscuta europaea TaxID=41803 RepID=A0A9P0YP51_CUSEU|nr:unnamed protein product [Cuscuta europaea]